jgi:hypothetical protein
MDDMTPPTAYVDPGPTMATDNTGPCQATDPKELGRQITSWSVPKNEREWWACREIERLKEANAELRLDHIAAHRVSVMTIHHIETKVETLRDALQIARDYMDGCLGNPHWNGANPYTIIDAALGHEQKAE